MINPGWPNWPWIPTHCFTGIEQHSSSTCLDCTITHHLALTAEHVLIQNRLRRLLTWLRSLYSLTSTHQHLWCVFHPTAQSAPAARLCDSITVVSTFLITITVTNGAIMPYRLVTRWCGLGVGSPLRITPTVKTPSLAVGGYLPYVFTSHVSHFQWLV